MNDDITQLRLQLKQLKAQRDSGAINAKAYGTAKASLERQLLDQVLEAPPAGKGGALAASTTPRPSGRLVGLLSVAVLVVAGIGYGLTGSPGMPSAGPPGTARSDDATASHADDATQFAAAVEKLAERLKQQPDNVEGWAILARSYARLGRHADAVPAYEKAVVLEGNNAGLLADYADTLAVHNNRSLEGKPTQLLERALKLEPDHAKALALAGTAAFNRKDYKTAVRHWEHLARVAPPDGTFVQQLQDSIAEARTLGGLPPGKTAPMAAAAGPTAAPAPDAASTATAGAATSAGSLQGSVRLSPELAKLAAPDDTVFVFARPAEGSRMPLAIQRYRVKDLPVEFRLDDSQAMSPATRLSAFPQVVVGARVSKTGQATPSAGDLVGLSKPVANNARGVVIEINEATKN